MKVADAYVGVEADVSKRLVVVLGVGRTPQAALKNANPNLFSHAVKVESGVVEDLNAWLINEVHLEGCELLHARAALAKGLIALFAPQ